MHRRRQRLRSRLRPHWRARRQRQRQRLRQERRSVASVKYLCELLLVLNHAFLKP
jgi:hypothetical protein